MAGLDFSALNKLAYGGFDTAEAREQKDALIEDGFTVVDTGKENPFLQASGAASVTPPASAAQKPTATTKPGPARKIEAFMTSSGLNVSAVYRAVYEYHKRHEKPFVDVEYWRTHKPGEDNTPQAELDYWKSVGEEASILCKEFNSDPLMLDFMSAVYAEIDRAYKRAREQAAKREGNT